MGQTLKDPEVSGGTDAADRHGRRRQRAGQDRPHPAARSTSSTATSPSSCTRRRRLPTYSDFPQEYERTANFFAALGVDQNFEGTGLTARRHRRRRHAGHADHADRRHPGRHDRGRRRRRPRSSATRATSPILPPGEDALPQFALKFTGRLDFAESFAALADVYYSRDPNQTRLVREGPEDLLEREFGEFNQLGFNFTLQAKF